MELNLHMRFFLMVVVFFSTAGIMFAYSGIFVSNDTDWSNVRHGPMSMLRGENPYVEVNGDKNATFNPPQTLIVAFPWIFGSKQVYVLMMLAGLGVLVVVTQRWLLTAYLVTPPFLVHVLAATNVGFQVGTLGMASLWLAQSKKGWQQTLLITWGYGLLLVKPQLGAAVVALHFFRFVCQDKQAVLRLIVLCGLVFFVLPTLIGLVASGGSRWLWYDWVKEVLLRNRNDFPMPYDTRLDSFVKRFGPVAAGLLTLLSVWPVAERIRSEGRWEWEKMTLADVFQIGFLLMVIWMIYSDLSVVGLAWMLTMTWRQVVIYAVIVWWLAVWIWPVEWMEGVVFIPIQAYYLIPPLLAFIDPKQELLNQEKRSISKEA